MSSEVKRPELACAVIRRRFPVGERPTRQPLQPEATGGRGLAMPRSLAGANPAQVTASHGPGIEPCRQSGNGLLDA